MNLGLMRVIDQQFLDTPFYGVRQMTWHLQNEGHGVNQKRIRRLMRLMRLMPIYQKPNTSKPRKGHKTYPYLLGGCAWTGPVRPGVPTSPTLRCGAAFFTWWRSWTGSRARCWPGASRIRWRPTSASRR
ncbi:MAG: IS3 family transposase [Gemmobacter sp.]|nr:IS3 family transposase [Gemmobacter sp.]